MKIYSMIVAWALQLDESKDIVIFMMMKLVTSKPLLSLDEILEASIPDIGIDLREKQSRIEKNTKHEVHSIHLEVWWKFEV